MFKIDIMFHVNSYEKRIIFSADSNEGYCLGEAIEAVMPHSLLVLCQAIDSVAAQRGGFKEPEDLEICEAANLYLEKHQALLDCILQSTPKPETATKLPQPDS